MANFQFTTSRRGRHGGHEHRLPDLFFQFTTSRRGRQIPMKSGCAFAIFQFTTSRRGRLYGGIWKNCMGGFQFTTSRRGRPDHLLQSQSFFCLSIHDLTKRSTEKTQGVGQGSGLSIHDLTKRSTSHSRFHTICHSFQFTTSRRGRRSYGSWIKRHIPFNSRPHEEVDSHREPWNTIHTSFNSRPHEEVDKFGVFYAAFSQPFNSRPHEEVDSKYPQFFPNNQLSYWLLQAKHSFIMPLYVQIFYQHFYYALSLSVRIPEHFLSTPYPHQYTIKLIL